MSGSWRVLGGVLVVGLAVACGEEKATEEPADSTEGGDSDDDGLDDGGGSDGGGSDDGGSDSESSVDSDGDGLSDADEATLGTDPDNEDSDGDGLQDGAEREAGTNPLDGDTDDDGLEDGEEVDLGTDPLDDDSDDDGLEDGEEMELGTDPLDGDSDDDGLDDGEEVELGSNPLSGDSDGDGFDDAEELAAHTDPDDASDHPYAGGWVIDSCRHDLEALASSRPMEGSVAPNFTLMDQFGEDVTLHDFCGQAVVIAVGAEWCGPCRAYRSTLQGFWEDYHEQGLMVIDLLGESSSGGVPTQSTLQSWSNGDDYAVLADPGWAVSNTGYVSGAIPAVSVLTEGGVVVHLETFNPSATDIEGALP